VKPWFLENVKNHPKINCMYPESDNYDCDFHILDCENDGCTCENPIKIGGEKYGECTAKKRKVKKVIDSFNLT